MDNFNPIQYVLSLLGRSKTQQPSKEQQIAQMAQNMKVSYPNARVIDSNTMLSGGPAVVNAAEPSPIAMAQQMAQPQIQPQTQAQMPTPQATPISIPQDQLARNIASTWGPDTPLLKNLQMYMQAGNKLGGNMEKLLPIALALRETQGGKYNVGQNNVGNLRNDTGAFQDYPDERTAVLGNLDQGGQSGGITGLLNGDKPASKNIYADFRRTNDYRDLFSHWSPPKDKNGSLDVQADNIKWILNKLKQ